MTITAFSLGVSIGLLVAGLRFGAPPYAVISFGAASIAFTVSFAAVRWNR